MVIEKYRVLNDLFRLEIFEIDDRYAAVGFVVDEQILAVVIALRFA